MQQNRRSGFTLIELSIVLVIIGLIVGGILVGQDLIHTAAIRAQLTQIESLQSSVNTFRVKYNGIPGDLKSQDAAQLGFASRAGTVGLGDGDGFLEAGSALHWGLCGENLLFWSDLSAAGLIGGSFTGGDSFTDCSQGTTPANPISNFFPSAKIGSSQNVISVTGALCCAGGSPITGNYFYIAGFTGIQPGGRPSYVINGLGGGVFSWGRVTSSHDIFIMDQKVDDGLPSTGNIVTILPGMITLPRPPQLETVP